MRSALHRVFISLVNPKPKKRRFFFEAVRIKVSLPVTLIAGRVMLCDPIKVMAGKGALDPAGMGIIKSLWVNPRGYFAMEQTPAAIGRWAQILFSSLHENSQMT